MSFYKGSFERKEFVSVVNDFVSAFKNQGDDDYQAVLATEQIFEHLAHQDITLGLCLMIELLPMAIDAYAHDVWDSIGLWIDAKGNADVLAYLKAQYKSTNNIDRKDIYAEQIDYVERKLS